MATIDDLMRATGLCRTTTKKHIASGDLPGYKVGARYIVPDEALDDFIHGRWAPLPRPVTLIQPLRPDSTVTTIHRRKVSA